MIAQTLSHFRVLDEVGAGGMGVVYRAHDEQLDRDVALKVLRPGLLADDSARRRFRREAVSLAKLNHPNIGAVYEFGGQDGLDFPVMELVSGVALDDRLASGSLSGEDVVRLGTQLASGLEAAHAEGIVHRDLKPGNLRLTPDGRLKILDFGLAQWIQPESEASPTVTQVGSSDVSGTIPYMAPEQLRGQKADARADIYSAGVVLYEMATGKRPFAGHSGPQLIGAILGQPPSSPRTHNHQISPALEAIILKAIDRDPNLRYQTARELRVDLERLARGATPQLGRSTHWGALAAAGALVAIAFIVGLNVGGWRDRLLQRAPRAGPAASHTTRRAIAVLGFKNLSGKPDHAWISTALAEMLTTEMAAGGQLRTIAGENVARMKLDLALADADSFGRETLQRIRNYSGTDLVVMGSYLALGAAAGGQIRLDFRLQDTRLGETLAAVSETGTEGALLELIARSGAGLRETLGVAEVSPSQASAVRASLPSDPQAARLYSEGLAKLRVFEAREARDLLEQAVTADQGHASARAALAAAWAALGYDNKAQDEARHAFNLSVDLPREERLSIEGRYREYSHEWPKADEALTTLDGLRRLAPPAGEDARIDVAESRAATSVGDFKRVLASARRAAVKGRIQGARFVVAQARADQGWAMERLGQTNDATAALVEAERLFSDAGNVLGAANAAHTRGIVLLDKGDFSGARTSFNDALVVFRRLGTQKRVAAALNNIGNSYYDQGDLAQAEKHYDEVLRIYRDVGDKQGAAGALGNLANVLDSMGDLVGARRMQEECLAAFREVGDKRGIASTLNNFGNLLAQLGDVAGAKQKYEESMAITEETGYKRGRAFSKYGLADVLAWEGKLDQARAAAEEALALRTALSDEHNVALSRMQVAAIAFEQGRSDEAVSLVREAIGVFDRIGAVEGGVFANALLARILLAKPGGAGAQRAAERATSLSRQSTNRAPRFEATLASARVAAVSGNVGDAVKKVESVLAEARKYRYVPYEYEARLALGEIEIASAKSPAAAARLGALEKDARARGYGLIARKAAKARG